MTQKKFSYLWASAILVIFVVSCNENKDDSPIPTDKMVNIISDIHIAEYYSQGLGKETPTFKKNHDSLALYYNSIMIHHQVSYDSFIAAYNWLMKHPVIMDSVYVKVLEQLEHLKKEYKTSSEYSNRSTEKNSDSTQSDTTTQTLKRPIEAGEQ